MRAFVAVIAATLAAGPAIAADTYPGKPLRIVVPFPAGRRPTSRPASSARSSPTRGASR